MKQLTAIIPFLNEGAEIERTVASIRETAGHQVDIQLINDNSQDDTDYEAVARRYNACYHYNQSRQGAARSRDIGVEASETPYFILFDGHMRFYHNDWWKAVAEALDNNDRAIYCLKCHPLDDQFQLKDTAAVGAYLNMNETTDNSILDPTWCKNRKIDGAIVQIPCVLGACYAASKRYWHYLKGATGLRTYGCEEAYMSLKTWLEGGACWLLPNIRVGHIFRKDPPYKIYTSDMIYNKLLIAETILPLDYKKMVYREMHRNNPSGYDEAMRMLCENRQLVAGLKKYYQQIFTRDIESFIRFNQSVQS